MKTIRCEMKLPGALSAAMVSHTPLFLEDDAKVGSILVLGDTIHDLNQQPKPVAMSRPPLIEGTKSDFCVQCVLIIGLVIRRTLCGAMCGLTWTTSSTPCTLKGPLMRSSLFPTQTSHTSGETRGKPTFRRSDHSFGFVCL